MPTIALTFLLVGCGGKGPESVQTPTPAPGANGAQPGQPSQPRPLSADEVALLQAASGGDTARAKALLDQGVNVNLRGSDGRTPLTEASFAGHAETVKLLLERGADPSLKKADGADAVALGQGHKEVADIFRGVTSLIEAASSGDAKTVKQLLDRGISPNSKDAGGRTPLTEAAWNGKTEVVKLLLEKGANPNLKKSDGASPADLARAQGHQEIVDLLNGASAKSSPAAQASQQPAARNQNSPPASPAASVKGKK
jgi:ankyrin repeat protein